MTEAQAIEALRHGSFDNLSDQDLADIIACCIRNPRIEVSDEDRATLTRLLMGRFLMMFPEGNA